MSVPSRGRIYVAEMAAACVGSPIDSPRHVIQSEARQVVRNPQLGSALDQAQDLARKGVSTHEAAKTCGTSGFVVHTVPFATFIFLRYGDDPLFALTEAVSAGGDTDSIGAIVGGWLGALHGARQMPGELLDRIHDGPFGPTHLRALGAALSPGPGRRTMHRSRILRCWSAASEPGFVPGHPRARVQKADAVLTGNDRPKRIDHINSRNSAPNHDAGIDPVTALVTYRGESARPFPPHRMDRHRCPGAA